jgi:hypothetical protein
MPRCLAAEKFFVHHSFQGSPVHMPVYKYKHVLVGSGVVGVRSHVNDPSVFQDLTETLAGRKEEW